MESNDLRVLLPPRPIDVVFDLETDSAERQWSSPIGSFVRIAGATVDDSEVYITTDMVQLMLTLWLSARGGGRISGHHILGYDLLMLSRHHDFVRPWSLANRAQIHDTKLTEALRDPPPARMTVEEANRYYSLDNVCNRLFGSGKTGDLRALAKEFGGFDRIPLDDDRYRTYIEGDVTQARRLANDQLPLSEYAKREHLVAALAAEISLNGFRVDRDLLNERIREGEEKRARILAELRDRYGLPTHTKGGKKESNSPHRTEAGKLALWRAFGAAGVPANDYPVTGKGNLAFGKDAMNLLRETYPDNQAVLDLADVVSDLNGIRTIYDTVATWLTDEDRVHPSIDLRQASGRWSFSNPGLTVIGKRAGRVREREIFLADPGEVIVAVDLSQVDARAVAAFCQDPNYMDLFAEGRDLWTEMGKLFGISRNAVKVIGHGSNYGMGIAGTLRHNPQLTRSQVEAFHNGRAEQFPGLIAWQNEVREQAQSGAFLDNGWGRLLRVDPERAYTQAPALSGQSAARDIMMEGLLNLARRHPETVPMLRAVVHDEVVLSVPADTAQDVAKAVQECMSFDWVPKNNRRGSRPIPIRAGAEVGGRTWASAYAEK